MFPGRGFTLIEMMVVVVVMAILSSAVLPSIVSAVRRTGAKAVARKSFDLLNFACASAVARRRPVTVNFDTERRVCWVSIQVTSLPWLSEDALPEARTLTSIELPEGVDVYFYRDTEWPDSRRSEQRWETVRFEPDGTGEDIIIELVDRSGDSYTVEVAALSGEVLLKREQ